MYIAKLLKKCSGRLKIIFFAGLFLGGCLPAEAQLYSFEKIGLEEGIPSARVNDFLEDSRGFFWLATEGAGLVRYDGFEFKTIPFDQEKMQPVVTALAEDPQGNIWLGAENMLIKYNGLSFRYFSLPEKRERISRIAPGNNGEIFVLSQEGVYRFDPAGTITKLSGNGIRDIAFISGRLYKISDSTIFTGSETAAGNFTVLEPAAEGVLAGGRKGLYFFENGRQTLVSSGKVTSVSGNLKDWAALGEHSLLVSQNNRVVTIKAENGLPEEDFKGCYIDRGGVVWLYSNNGLTKLRSTAARLFTGEEQNGDAKVFSVLVDEGTVYSGVVNGLKVIKDNRERVWSYPYGVPLSLARFGGQVWIGSERGLYRFDGRNFIPVTLPAVSGGIVFSLKASAGALWIGTSSGIFRFRDGMVLNITAREGFPAAPVYSIREAPDGSLWCGTYNDGFFRRLNTGWEHLTELGNMKLDSLRFTSFEPLNRNTLFVGTIADGLFLVGEGKQQHISYASLRFSEVRALLYDHDQLWIGTNKGLWLLDPDKEEVKIKSLPEFSVFLEEGCMPFALDVEKGILVAGTGSGTLVIDSEQQRQMENKPRLAITDVELFYGEVSGIEEYGEDTLAFYNVPANLNLPYDLNFISFTLAGLTGYEPDNLVYRYRVNTYDNWTLAGNRREAVFSNLKPGRYIFEAQVSRPGGTWSDAVSYPFNIKSPLWQRWWFILISVLLVGGITFWVINDRIRRTNQRLRLENSLLEMERKALRLQMNPHFIFNALDSISSFIFKNDQQQAVRYLNNFAKLMRLTLESSMEHLHPVETEVSILKNYLELEKLRFGDKFDYDIFVDEEIDYDVGITPMLIQPHVENAILHGIKPKEGKGYLNIRFILEGDFLICEVEDDGIGRRRSRERPKRKDHRSMATRINRDRLRLLKISRSEEIDIRIIDKPDDSGTKVVIKLPAESI